MSSQNIQCSNCVMDTTDPEIVFDENGVCSYCLDFQLKYADSLKNLSHQGLDASLLENIQRIKDAGKNNKYDCVIGLSGGVDSSYLALKVKELGLRPIAVHFDSGWNSEIAVRNIENIIKKLDIDLYTHVCDWNEMKDLQLSFFKAGVPNCDIPTDHAFIAVLYKIAAKYNIKYIINGGNLATESVLPKSWGHASIDLRHIKHIQKIFGSLKLKKYPQINLFMRYIFYPILKSIKEYRLLNFIHYDKKEAKKIIQSELSWQDYGGKHYESIFTKFFQSYYLVEKFGFDKRKAHLSSLILSNQISRDEALDELKINPFDAQTIDRDKLFLSKKMGIKLEEFEKILNAPKKNHTDYNTSYFFKFYKYKIFKKLIAKKNQVS